jgi:hypothetical protein
LLGRGRGLVGNRQLVEGAADQTRRCACRPSALTCPHRAIELLQGIEQLQAWLEPGPGLGWACTRRCLERKLREEYLNGVRRVMLGRWPRPSKFTWARSTSMPASFAIEPRYSSPVPRPAPPRRPKRPAHRPRPRRPHARQGLATNVEDLQGLKTYLMLAERQHGDWPPDRPDHALLRGCREQPQPGVSAAAQRRNDDQLLDGQPGRPRVPGHRQHRPDRARENLRRVVRGMPASSVMGR